VTPDDMLARLVAAGVEPTQARLFAPAMNDYLAEMTMVRIGHFVGQLRHESNNFTRLEENLRYRTPQRLLGVFGRRRVGGGLDEAARLCLLGPKAIANRVYAGMLGNGDEASGDGWTYRGGGLIQLTGRANYEAQNVHPGEVRTPEGAVRTAVDFFTYNRIWRDADNDDVEAVTRKVNGPRMLGLEERRNFTREALSAFLA
jgi:putative chitinase